MSSVITQNLPCPLTDDEVRQRGEQIASLLGSIGNLKNDRKKAMAEFKAQIEALEVEVGELGSQVRLRSENRPVTCYEETDLREGVVRRYRSDTRALVRTHHLSPDEVRQLQQGKLFPISGEAKEG